MPRLLLIAAVVLIVFALIAAISTSGLCLGSAYGVWLAAALLAYFADLLLGGTLTGLYNGRRRADPPA